MTLSMVVEHLSMVVFAIVIAILIGVPLGLLCYLSRAARGVAEHGGETARKLAKNGEKQ